MIQACRLSATMNYYPGINISEFAAPSCQGCSAGRHGWFYAYASSNTHVVIDLVGVGQPGMAPSGRAAAYVTTSATFDAARTRNSFAVSRPATGVYCLTPSALDQSGYHGTDGLH